MNYKLAIIAASIDRGIDPAIPLAVATRESGVQQFRPDGSIVVGKAGEIGIFQVKPSSAPGVDLRDPQANINAGVSMLASLHRQFRGWPLALAAYNWGEHNVRQAMAGIKTVPASVTSYVTAVLGPGQLSVSPAGRLSPAAIVVGVIFGAGIFLIALR